MPRAKYHVIAKAFVGSLIAHVRCQKMAVLDNSILSTDFCISLEARLLLRLWQRKIEPLRNQKEKLCSDWKPALGRPSYHTIFEFSDDLQNMNIQSVYRYQAQYRIATKALLRASLQLMFDAIYVGQPLECDKM